MAVADVMKYFYIKMTLAYFGLLGGGGVGGGDDGTQIYAEWLAAGELESILKKLFLNAVC